MFWKMYRLFFSLINLTPPWAKWFCCTPVLMYFAFHLKDFGRTYKNNIGKINVSKENVKNRILFWNVLYYFIVSYLTLLKWILFDTFWDGLVFKIIIKICYYKWRTTTGIKYISIKALNTNFLLIFFYV